MANIKPPKTCRHCDFMGRYTDGPYSRHPHYCCELIWGLHRQDYQIDPDTIDDECPLKNKHIQEYFKETHEKFDY